MARAKTIAPVTSSERIQNASEAWRDPEFWPPPGLGCARCHVRRPIVFEVGFGGALCEVCLGNCFGWTDFEQGVAWLGRQHEKRVRNERRIAALKAYNEKNDTRPAMEYKQEYGVWLLQRPEP